MLCCAHGRLKDTPIKVFSLHPGNIVTNLQRHNQGFALNAFFAIGRCGRCYQCFHDVCVS